MSANMRHERVNLVRDGVLDAHPFRAASSLPCFEGVHAFQLFERYLSSHGAYVSPLEC